MDISEAKKLLDDEKRERALACGKEIEEVLRKYRCVLDAKPNLQVVPQDTVANDAAV